MNEITWIDVIFLSFAQTDELREVTTNAVQSLYESEDSDKIKFNTLVFESQNELKPFQYDYSETIYPVEDFNFHKYFNMGINMTSAPFICLCNNDLIFQKGWATQILDALDKFPDVLSASPICPYHTDEISWYPKDQIWFGYRPAVEVRGACLFFKRELFKHIGQLDPNCKFYHADDDYAHTLQVLDLKHILVTSSVVIHLGSKTLKKQSQTVKLNLTDEQDAYYIKKWFYRLGKRWVKVD